MVRSHHDPAFRKTPIIMLSALGSTDDRVKGYGLGADLYLPKPYTMKEVMIKSSQLVQQHHDFLRLNRQVSSLQNWADLQDQWQQALFHELRNQLTVISGMALHLQQDRELPPGRTEQFAEQISSSSHYLGTLAENYLLVQRLEGKQEQLQGEPLLLADLLSELQQLFQPLAEQKACELEIFCDEAILLNLHPVGLKIVLSGLVDNALKYTLLDSHVHIDVSRTCGEVLIRVEDDGPGIPESQRGQIFEKFYRGEPGKDQPGTGLGLYVARTLTEVMGGSLTLAAGNLLGCCLELRFPIVAGDSFPG
jgi:signal transduction histidine kinase